MRAYHANVAAAAFCAGAGTMALANGDYGLAVFQFALVAINVPFIIIGARS